MRALVPFQLVRGRDVVLVPVLRVVPVRTDRQPGEDVFGRGRRSILERRVDELVMEPVDFYFLQQIVPHHTRPVAGDEIRVMEPLGAASRTPRGREEMRVLPVEVVAADEQVVLGSHLVVGASERVMLECIARQRDGFAPVRRRSDDGRVRLALVLVRNEVVELVLDDRAAQRPARLLIRIRQYLAGVRVRGIELVAAEVAVRAAAVAVRARFRDGLHLQSDGAAHRDVEHVGDDLILGDGVAADPRLAEAGDRRLLRDFLAVQVDPERRRSAAAVGGRRVVDLIRGDALHHRRELQPVAAVDRELFHLAAIDVAGDLRLTHIDQRRGRRHGERLLHVGDSHRKRDRRVLPDEQLHHGQHRLREPGELGLKPVGAGLHAHQTIFTTRIGHVDELTAGADRRRRHRHARKNRFRFVHDAADNRCLDLCVGGDHGTGEDEQKSQKMHAYGVHRSSFDSDLLAPHLSTSFPRRPRTISNAIPAIAASPRLSMRACAGEDRVAVARFRMSWYLASACSTRGLSR